VAPIARGGFGAVYVAEQLTTERRVALKVLTRYAEVSVERLLAEARVTSRIISDHIVQVIDAGVDTDTGDVFVVMELLRGLTLDDRLMERGALSIQETAEILRQVAAGLDKAHGQVDRAGHATPIVHRDLKPSNIFLSARDDGHPWVKILDFGAAKVLSQTTKASGLIRGTPQFMASEQAMGEPSSPATDIWALGLIAFNLLSGHSYWLTVKRDGTEAQMFAEILTLPLVPASQRARELGLSTEFSAVFDRWFLRCVNRDPSQRFASAGLAASELSRALGVDLPRASAAPTRPLASLPVVGDAAPTAPPAKLETHEIAALSNTSRVPRPNRARTTVATVFVLLAGAAGATTVVLWKRVPASVPPPSSISASPRPLDSRFVPSTFEASAPSAVPSAAPSATLTSRPAVKATAHPRDLAEKHAPTRARPAVKPVAPPRDPYQQR